MARQQQRSSRRPVEEAPARRTRKAEPEPAPKHRARAEPEPAPKRRTKAVEEVPSRRTKKVEEAPAPKRRAKAVEEAPAPRRRAKVVEEAPAPKRRAKVVEEAPKKRRAKTEVEVEEAPPKKRTKKEAIDDAKATSSAFNPYSHLDDVLDVIEREVGLSESSMDPSEARLSTGMLMLDILLGGGITAGWYTNFGQEQTCKTTGAVTIMSAALNSNVPILTYFDFEGCLTYDAQVTVNGVKQHLGDLFVGLNLKPYEAVDTSKMQVTVETPCGAQQVTAIMYKGPKPCVHIDLENGSTLEGYKHKELVCTSDELLVWKYIEDLVIGDRLVVRPSL